MNSQAVHLASAARILLDLCRKLEAFTEPKTPEEQKAAGIITIIHEPITKEELLGDTSIASSKPDCCDDRDRGPSFYFFLLGG